MIGSSEYTQYLDILRNYYACQDEEFLMEASELGQVLVKLGFPPEELGSFHLEALEELQKEPRLSHGVFNIKTSTPIFTELLMAYGLAFREQISGLRTQEENLRGAQDKLEQRVLKRTQELQEKTKEYKKAQVDAETSKKLFDSIINQAGEAIIVLNHDMKIIIFNNASEHLFGYTSAEVIGQSLDKLLPLDVNNKHVLNIKEFRKSSQNVTQKSGRGEIRGVRMNGSEFPMEVTISKFVGQNGYVFTITLRDITERLSYESNLFLAKEKAEFSSRAKSEFLSVMGHELRTPLNAILGFSDMLLEGHPLPNDIEVRESAKHIHESGMRLHQMIENVLDVSSIATDDLELNKSLIDVSDLLCDCVQLAQGQAVKNKVKLLNVSKANHFKICADKQRLCQILSNLLSNAIKFSGTEDVVSVSAYSQSGNKICFLVEDHGMGMTDDEITVALEPFRQVDNRLARSHEGAGLGLYLAQKLTEFHDGELRIVSRKGMGTKISVIIPCGMETSDGHPTYSH